MFVEGWLIQVVAGAVGVGLAESQGLTSPGASSKIEFLFFFPLLHLHICFLQVKGRNSYQSSRKATERFYMIQVSLTELDNCLNDVQLGLAERTWP